MKRNEENEQVENFIQDVLFIDEEKGGILKKLRVIVQKTCPSVTEEIKYGGLVFNIGKDLLGGIFFRKKHISLEFSYGYLFQDADKYLEGSGKFRRHLKLYSLNDISGKKADYYIKQAFGKDN
ncbi:hypothetical protein CHISP_1500 [Chitinispirillum alkaliphilum]|nr:hypothetical protein CHISP_1500 [Chitinispirillum alkaliphilum]